MNQIPSAIVPISIGSGIWTTSLFPVLPMSMLQHHNTLVGFAMDNGCHDVEPFIAQKDGQMRYATHKEDIPEDMNIVHHYKIYPAAK